MSVIDGLQTLLASALNGITSIKKNGKEIASIEEEYTTSGGTYSGYNISQKDTSSITGGTANVCLGGAVPGMENIITDSSSGEGRYRTLSGGYDNTIDSTGIGADVIAGGAHHQITDSANHSTISGGSYNIIDGTSVYATIAGGTHNTITDCQYGFVAGANASITGDGHVALGANGTITNGTYSAIIGGNNNTMTASSWSVVNGGDNNTISDANRSCIIASNTSALKHSASASIIGGEHSSLGNTSTAGDYCSIIGGYYNEVGYTHASSFSSVIGGRSNKIRGDYGAIIGGRENEIDDAVQRSAVIGGYQQTATLSETVYLPKLKLQPTTEPTGLGAGDAGLTYYDSTSNKMRCWNGTIFNDLS